MRSTPSSLLIAVAIPALLLTGCGSSSGGGGAAGSGNSSGACQPLDLDGSPFGATGTAIWPHGWIYATPQNSWGPVPVESWLIAGVLYVGLVAVVHSMGRVRDWLGFAKTVPDDVIPTEAVADVATLAGA